MKKQLKNDNQAHLYAHLATLEGAAKADFQRQIEQIDFAKIERLYNHLTAQTAVVQATEQLMPIEPHQPTAAEAARYIEIGRSALRQKKVAALLLAGGQGTRLGHAGPKGTYDIGVAAGRSLFELHAKSLKARSEACGQTIDWLIMTSQINHAATLAFFEKNDYFGYARSAIHFFQQGMIEAVDFTGKVIIQDRATISRSPDGNGGCFKALADNGLVDRLIADGYEWLFVFNVDNAIVNIADPLFIGYTIAAQQPCAAKVVAKTSAAEKVGIPCIVAGKPTIVEYSELSEAQLTARDQSGRLRLRGGNIGSYCLNLAALRDYLAQPLHYHLATKKIPYLNSAGQQVTPTEPNGYKFELFIFDIFPAFSGMAVLEVERADEFAPVKNASGADSSATARALFEAKWQKAMGGSLEK